MNNAIAALEHLKVDNKAKREALVKKYLSQTSLSNTQVKKIQKLMLTPAGDPISALPGALTPLTYSELMPIVQSGVTKKAPLSYLATFQALGFKTVGLNGGPAGSSGFNFSTIQEAYSSNQFNLILCTDITETLDADFEGISTIVFASGITLNCNDAQTFKVRAGMAGTLILTGYPAGITFAMTTNRALIDRSEGLPSIPNVINNGFLFVNNQSAPSVGAPFINDVGMAGTFDTEIGSMIYFMNGNAGSANKLDHCKIDTFIALGSNSTPEAALTVQTGGSISSLILSNDTNSSSVVVDLNRVAVASFQTITTTSAGIFNFTDCSLSNRNFTGAVPVVNITYTDALSDFPPISTPSINFLNGDGDLVNRTPLWAAGFLPDGAGGAVPMTGIPVSGMQFVLNSLSGPSKAFEAKPVQTRQGSNVSPIPVVGVGSFVDFQSFTLAANLIEQVGQRILFESEGTYLDDVTIQCVFSPLLGSENIFTVNMPAPTSGPQNYQLTWKITRFSSTQANAYLCLKGGVGVDNFECCLSTIISTIDWTSPITLKTQGRCNVTTNTLVSDESCYSTR